MTRSPRLQCNFNRTAAASKRPALSPRLTLRFTQDEIERLKSAAGNMTLSAYIRRQIFGSATSSRKSTARRPLADQQSLARLLGRLGQSGIPENIARLAQDNRTGCLAVDEETEAAIREACAFVRAMRDDLVAALGLSETRSS
jgi:RNase P/RNase MRP subunit POP5